MKTLLTVPLLLLLTLFHPIELRAQWQPDGTALSTAIYDQDTPTVIPDGAGGAFVTWEDSRTGAAWDIYAQRVNALGAVQWTANGVVVCSAPGDQFTPTIVSDGAGGIIVTWEDWRAVTTSDIYAQRVNGSGVVQWAGNGVALCAAANSQYAPKIVSDGAGGTIVAWEDWRTGGIGDIYAQRVNASGTVQWAGNGVAVCTAANTQTLPMIVSNGAGGAIVTWQDFRILANADIYAQGVTASGAIQWTPNGIALCTAANEQASPMIVSDGAGGAIVTWQDLRTTTNYDIYAQRVNAVGAVQWTANGAVVCTAVSDQDTPTIISDGANGAIVTWEDRRNGTDYDIYALRLNDAGQALWTSNGVALCTTTGNQGFPTLVSDGAGGAIVAWQDYRGGANYDVYAQRVDVFGTAQWAANGMALSVATGYQYYPVIVSDGAGGAIVTWQDYRSGANYDIYAQRVEGSYGYWGQPDPIVVSVKDIPHDQGGRVALNWTASGRDRPAPATIDFYSIWRATNVAPVGPSANAGTAVAAFERITADTPPGVRTTFAASPYYWELVGTQTAYRWPYYSFSAATRADSLAGNPGNEFFMVAAHERTDEHIAFPSNVVSGHSVDNLAPTAPLFLTAQRAGANVNLRWNRVLVPDLRDYAVYRKTSSGVTPVPINFLSNAADTVLVDASAPTSALYYIVTAYDVHANQSPASNEAAVAPATGVGSTPAITQLTMLQNRPNPFTGTTEFDIGLPVESEVALEVYDVAGRLVRNELLARQKAGWQRVSFDGRDSAGRALASGVYFCRVTANGATVTRKMVIAR